MSKPNKGLPKYNGLIDINRSQQSDKHLLKNSLRRQCEKLRKEIIKKNKQ